jgi:hypothetical protein
MTNGTATPPAALSTDTSVTSATIALEIKRTEERYRFFRQAVMWCGICILGYLAKDSIVALAGQSTNVIVQMGLKVISDVRVTVSWAVTGGFGLWAFGERKIRQKRVLQLHARIKDLETAIDPDRSTSKLTPEGKTNPQDRSLL